jgi:signal transduction histidine kinase
MWTIDVLRSRAFRLALAFALAIAAAATVVFTLIYLQISSASVQMVSARLTYEANRALNESDGELRAQIAQRLVSDLRRLDYAGLFDAQGALLVGDPPSLPPIRPDGRAHLVAAAAARGAGRPDQAIFVAVRRPDGTTLVLGRSLSEINDLREAVAKALAFALAPTTVLILVIGAVFARRAQRRLGDIHAAIAEIMKGDLKQRLPVMSEVDDLDRVARGVNLMLDEIWRLLDQLRHIGDDIAHDLRTPLAVARAKIERGLERGSTIDELRAAMAEALVHLDRSAATISAFLRVSAMESGRRERGFGPVDLSAVCAGLFEFYEPLAHNTGVAIALAAPRPALVRGDEDLLREAISNLVDNAIKFTPEGGRVLIAAATADGQATVEVSDSGCGVPQQDREDIFRRFYRSGRDGAAPGYGLGLNIVAAIAKLHGFRLTVEDNAPGARFALRGDCLAFDSDDAARALDAAPTKRLRSSA